MYTAVASPDPIASVRARPSGSARSAATSAPSRHASTGTIAPMTTLETCAARNAASRVIELADFTASMGSAARREGSGSQTSNASRGKRSGCVWKDHSASETSPRPSTRFRATPT